MNHKGWDITSVRYWHVESNIGPPILKRGIKMIKQLKKIPYHYTLKKKNRKILA